VSTPQQPELARSKRSAATPDSAKTKAKVGGAPASKGNTGPVPDDNVLGHHPDDEQDKPGDPPPALMMRPKPGRERFDFAFEPRMAPFSFALGVTPWTASVDVRDGELRIRFGLWSLRTAIDNVERFEATGPYSWIKVVGPPRLSMADTGVTFATNSRRGVCLCFREPVPGAFPGRLARHAAATVTVADPDELVYALEAAARTEELRAATS
jgi:hypothetical protein